MNQKQVKRLMTDVAKGKFTMEEAKKQMKPKTLKTKSKEVKQSHNHISVEQSQ